MSDLVETCSPMLEKVPGLVQVSPDKKRMQNYFFFRKINTTEKVIAQYNVVFKRLKIVGLLNGLLFKP